jgi:hypothetical protein
METWVNDRVFKNRQFNSINVYPRTQRRIQDLLLREGDINEKKTKDLVFFFSGDKIQEDLV